MSELKKAQQWDDELTGVALSIASTDESPLRVLAGPGTGKSYAMKRRVMRLLQEDVAPKRILACTFTRTAARDIAREIAGLGVVGAEHVAAVTLHGLCFSILQRQDVLAKTGRTARPLGDTETKFLIHDLKGAFGGVRETEKRLEAFGAAWARLQTDEPGWPKDKTDKAFQKALDQWLRFHEAMLVGEMVPVTLRYVKDNPLCPERTKFDHVIVDEFQDLNKAEQVLVDFLAENAQLSIIGDEDQSIYSFKHAHPDGITDFHSEHDGTHDETLDMCRRCPTKVISIANSLISHNASASGRVLKPNKEKGQGIVHVVQWPSLETEAHGIADYILKRIEEDDVEAGQVLILAPRRKIGYAVRDAILEKGVLAHSFFNEQALEGNPTKLGKCQPQQAYALLTLLAEPEDRVALRCWCGFGSATLNENGWKRLRGHCEDSGENPREVLQQIIDGTLKVSGTTKVVERFAELRAQEEALEDVSGHALADILFPDGEAWAEQLRDIVTKSFPPHVDFTAEELLTTVRAGVTQLDPPTDADFVRVMSLHKSKGLTARLVIVMGCIEGMIPDVDYKATIKEQEAMREEHRRLFYVALTRPTETLVLSSATFIPTDQAFGMGLQSNQVIASSFLSELGPDKPKPVAGTTLL